MAAELAQVLAERRRHQCAGQGSAAELVERDAAEIVAAVDHEAGAEAVVETFLDRRQRTVCRVADEIFLPRQRRIVLRHGRRRHQQRHRVLPLRKSLYNTADETGRKSLQPVVTLCSGLASGLILVTRLAVLSPTFC